jgi:hypothetical protein
MQKIALRRRSMRTGRRRSLAPLLANGDAMLQPALVIDEPLLQRGIHQ